MRHKKYSMTITEDEREWFHSLAKTQKTSIPLLIIHCFRKQSKQLGINLPENIIPDNKRQYQCQYAETSPVYKEIKEESFQMSFI